MPMETSRHLSGYNRSPWILAVWATVTLGLAGPGNAQTNQPGQTAEASTAQQGDGDGWPRRFETPAGSTMVLYQPQVTDWQNFTDLSAMIAAEYTRQGSDSTSPGVIHVSAKTVADQDAGTVAIYDVAVANLNFSTLDRNSLADAALEVGKVLPTGSLTLSLDRVTASLSGYTRMQDATGLQSEAPPIFVRTEPAILVQTNGQAVTAAVELTSRLSFVVNTNWDVLKTDAYYLRDDKSWLTASALTGPWQAAATLPAVFGDLPDNDNWKEAKAAIPPQPFAGTPPTVVYSEQPAELILIDGQPTLEDVPGTALAWVSNTQSDLFFLKTDNTWYFLTSGRWFSAADLNGPWAFATTDLPADFQRIPAGQPYSAVRASVPGTSDSDEARLQATIPQTARVERDAVSVNVTYSGDPDFVRIDGTSLSYATNTNFVVIRVGNQYYVCDGGIWFVGSSPTGPFIVADTVPDEIYTIPPSSPVYNVTYVYVYGADPAAVWFGFTAGYLWGYLAWDTYVYGTGYYYPPYWYRRPNYPPVYYPRPVFYGGGIYYDNGSWGRYGYAYGPYRGVEAGGWYNPETGRYVRSAAAWGPYGEGGFIAAGNVNTGRRVVAHGETNPYANWGSVGVKSGSNWAVARGYTNDDGAGAVRWKRSSGDRGFAGQTGSSDLYAGRDGNVYRKTDNGWQKYDDGSWSSVDRPQAGEIAPLGAENRSQDRNLPARAQQAERSIPETPPARAQQAERKIPQTPPTLSRPSQQTTETGPQLRQPQAPSRPPPQFNLSNETVRQNLDRTYEGRQRGNALAAQSNKGGGTRCARIAGCKQGASAPAGGQLRRRR